MIPFNSLKSAKKSLKPSFSRFFLSFLFICQAFFSHAQWETIHGFEKDWVVYLPAWNAFLPYNPTKHSAFKSKSIQINPDDYPKGFLIIQVDQDMNLFLNGVLQRKLQAHKVVSLRLDSLSKLHERNPLLTFTFYHPSLVGLPQNIHIERFRRSGKVTQTDFFNFKNRKTSTFYTFFTYSFLSLLILLAVLFSLFPKYFYTYFRFSDWLRWGEFKEEVIAKTPFALPNFILVLILSLTVGYLSFLNGMNQPNPNAIFENSNQDRVFGDILLFIGSKAGIAFILFFGRYIVYLIFSSLFRLTDLAEMHFFKSLQTNIQFFCVLFLIFGLSALNYGPLFRQDLSLISSLTNAFFLIRAFYFFQIFRKKFRNNQISLLAYLVIIEGQVFFYGIRELLFPEFM